jgi:DNA-binding response OmpR family regulator
MKNLRRKITVDDECIVKTIQGAGYTVEYTPEPQL